MKFFVTLIVVSLALVNAQNSASCTASGDPHFKTFDGCYHDFQGSGVFQAAKNSILDIRYYALPCNPPHAVTCINALYTAVTNPSGVTSVIICNVAGGQNTYYCIADGVRYTWANLTTAVPLKNGVGSLAKDGGYLAVIGLRGSWKVRAAQYQMIIDLLPSLGFYKETYGVCGFFNGEAADDFTGANGTLYERCALNTRVNNVNVNRWGASFAAAPFPLNGHTSLLSDMHLMAETDIPNSTVQDQLNKLAFDGFDSYTAAKQRCEAMGQSTDPVAVENCIYDAAVLGNFILAATNQEASINAGVSSSSGSSGLNGGAIAGIVLGCVAFVSLITALVLYVRLRKLRVEYSRALVVRSQAQGNAAATNTLADNL